MDLRAKSLVTVALLLGLVGAVRGEDAARLGLASDHITAGALAELIAAWGTLPAETELGYAPLPGIERRITRAELARWARREGLAANPENWPEAVIISREMVTLKASAAADLLAEYLAAQRGVSRDGVTVTITSYAEIEAPAGELAFSVAVLEEPPGAPWLFELAWADSSGRGGSGRLRAKVELPGPPPEPENPGANRQVEASRQGGDHRLAASSRNATKPEIVRRGAQLTLVAHSGPVQLRVPARAEEAGALGEWIRCTNLESGRTVQARIAGAKHVEVLLP